MTIEFATILFSLRVLPGAHIVRRHSAKRRILIIICKTTPTIVRPNAPCARRVSKINKIWHRTYGATKISGSICATCAANVSVHKVTWSTIGIRTLRNAIFIAISARNLLNRLTFCALIVIPYTQKFSDTNAKNADENSNEIIILS